MTGLYNGVAGLSGWTGLWGNVSSLWSGATGLQDGSGGTIWSTLGSGLTVFHDLNNTPVMKDFEGGIAAVGDPVALVFDSATWYGEPLATVLTAQTDVKSAGTTGLAGTATAASYNTGTGVGSVSRAGDVNNQSFVTWTGLPSWSVYAVDIENTGSAELQVRSGLYNGFIVGTLAAGQRKTVYAPPPVTPQITLVCSVNASTTQFTVHSFKQVPGYHMSQLTLANRPILRQDSLTGAYYLQADGTNDIMQTRSLDLSGTDKLGVFAAQRTTSIAGGLLLENSISSGISNGAFAVFTPMNPNTYGARVRGTSTADIPTPASYAPPNTGVMTLLGNLAGPTTAQLRVNGAVASSSNTAVGGGTFGNYQVFYLARSGGTVNRFTGNYYGDIIYSGTPTTAQIEYVEAYYNALALPPQLQLSFTTGVLDSRVTFTRSSTATFVGSNGLIQTAATNTPRFDYDPNGNLLTYSEQFDNVAWSKTATVTANQLAAPDGAINADLVSTVANFDYVRQVITATANALYTTTFFVKPVSGSTTVRILLTNPTQTEYAGSYFGLTGGGSLGAAITTGTGVLVSRSITNVGNGWYRCSVTATNNTTSLYALIDNQTGGVMSFGVWGAQLQEGPTATAYIPTTATAPVRTIKGLLLETQSTNLLTYSEQFDNAAWTTTNITVTADAAVSPDGATTADKLDEGAATGVHSVLQSFTSVSGQPYAVTFYLKNGDARYAQIFFGSAGHGLTAYANFDLQAGTVGTVGATATASMTYVGNGIYRCGIVATATASTAGASAQLGIITDSSSARALSYTGANKFIYAWGAQLEALHFASSYIPTVASQVTRTRDDAIMEGSNLTSWCNPNEGTLVSEHVARLGVDQQPFAIDLLSASYLLRTRQFANVYSFVVRDPTNRDLFSTPVPALTEGQIVKIAAAYATNDVALSGGGQAVSTGSVFTPFTPTRATIGTAAGTTSIHVRSVAYYNRRLTNAQLQALSTP